MRQLRRHFGSGRTCRAQPAQCGRGQGAADHRFSHVNQAQVVVTAWVRKAEKACSMLRPSLWATIPLACSMTTFSHIGTGHVGPPGSRKMPVGSCYDLGPRPLAAY